MENLFKNRLKLTKRNSYVTQYDELNKKEMYLNKFKWIEIDTECYIPRSFTQYNMEDEMFRRFPFTVFSNDISDWNEDQYERRE